MVICPMMLQPLIAKRRQPGYDCLNFAVDAIKLRTGHDLSKVLLEARRIEWRRHFVELDRPRRLQPTLVLFQREGYGDHVGVLLRGKVTHLREFDVRSEPLALASLGWDKVRFFEWLKPA